ncbi:Hcp family type VI secretion system effector [Vibrio quintilis]|uniref:Major exported protein n=1 Tax=Vibrio quintilis TaxID=1117707 RepID=A0A1M7YXX3_9VIBR|nr:Hcp family type VI secretion system effector [Vibrio quintilis]SHO57491.1 Major exported protein [Vibrio quintilis]
MAYMAYLTIIGETQGAISEGCNSIDSMGAKFQDSHRDEISVIAYEHHGSKGAGQHRKSHSPLYITKFIDKSSPLLASAFAKQEHLDCTLHFYRTNEQGFNEKFYSIELKKALISNLSSNLPNIISNSVEKSFTEMHEVIAFSYKEIIWKHNVSGTMGYDNWDQGGWGA